MLCQYSMQSTDSAFQPIITSREGSSRTRFKRKYAISYIVSSGNGLSKWL